MANDANDSNEDGRAAAFNCQNLTLQETSVEASVLRNFEPLPVAREISSNLSLRTNYASSVIVFSVTLKNTAVNGRLALIIDQSGLIQFAGAERNLLNSGLGDDLFLRRGLIRCIRDCVRGGEGTVGCIVNCIIDVL